MNNQERENFGSETDLVGYDDIFACDLVAFLHSLTGDNVDTLVADAFAAPVGDITEDDPN